MLYGPIVVIPHMESWGCEFVEDNGTTQRPDFPIVETSIVYVSMDMLEQIVDTRYLKEIGSKDKAQVQALTVDIARRGILYPGTLVYDNKKIRLQDGNHRYLAARALGLRDFPVQLRRVSRISAPGADLEFAFQYLWSAL